MSKGRGIKVSFLVMLSLYVTIQSGLCTASIGDEKLIEKLFSMHGKYNVAKVILDKRNGTITIQKNRSFIDNYGKPRLSYITPKSILYDLGLVGMSISELKVAAKVQQNKQTKVDEELKKASAVSSALPETETRVALSSELKQKIALTKQKYLNARDNTQKRRYQTELSILRNAYRRALKNEKPKVRRYSSNETKRKKVYKKNSSGCRHAKTQLKALSNPVARHQVFFCSDRKYRKQNPKSCDGQGYGRQYDLKTYQKEVARLKNQVSQSCK